MSYDVWATVQDPGEMAGMLPVVVQLQCMGISVKLLAAGHALGKLKAEGYGHWDATDPKTIAAREEAPRLLLATTAYKGGAGRDLIPLLRGKSKLVLLQNLWGGLAGWGPEHQPDYVITNDCVGEGVVTRLWPGLASGSVFKTGFPMLDRYADFDPIKEASAARDALNIKNGYPVIVFAGQSDATGTMLGELVEVLNPYRDSIHFVARPHPRMKSDYPSEVPLWDKALAKYRGKVVDSSQCTMRQLTAAAYNFGAVAAMYSASLLEAAATRTSGIAMLYPEALTAFRKENPGLDQFPLAKLGCVGRASTREELDAIVYTAITAGNVWRRNQETHIKAEGRNALLAAQLIADLLVVRR